MYKVAAGGTPQTGAWTLTTAFIMTNPRANSRAL